MEESGPLSGKEAMNDVCLTALIRGYDVVCFFVFLFCLVFCFCFLFAFFRLFFGCVCVFFFFFLPQLAGA